MAEKNGFKPCKDCPNPTKCRAAGKCLKEAKNQKPATRRG